MLSVVVSDLLLVVLLLIPIQYDGYPGTTVTLR